MSQVVIRNKMNQTLVVHIRTAPGAAETQAVKIAGWGAYGPVDNARLTEHVANLVSQEFVRVTPVA